MQRPTRFDEWLDAINAAFPNGMTFTTGDAGDAIMKRELAPSIATAVVYASQTLRYLLLIQDDCPESDQLKRINRRYIFQSA